MMRRYIFHLDNWRYGALVLLAGYAVGLFIWQMTHRPLLPAYLFENQLTADQRSQMIAWLLMGMFGAAIAWLAGSGLLARLGSQSTVQGQADGAAFWLTATARLSVALLLLPFLPILAVPGIEAQEPLLMLCMIVALSGLVAVATRQVLGLQSEMRTAERTHRLSPGLPAQAGTPDQLVQDRAPDRVGDTSPTIGRRSEVIALALVLALASGYALFMSLLTVGRHNAFGTNAYDLGIHAQSMYTIGLYGYPRVTLYGPEVVNQFSDHFAPIFYLLTPLYVLFSDPRALLVLQSIALAAGVVPVYLLARRKLASRGLALALAVSYLLFPALHGINNFDFHEIALVTPLLLWSLYFLETGRFRLFGGFLILACLTKEEVALTAVAIGLYIVLVRRQPRRGALVMALSALYFVLVTALIMPALGGGADVGRFEGLSVDGFGGFAGVAVTVFTNPFFTFDYALLNPDKLVFLAQLFLPLLGIPLLAGAGPWIVALPGFATLLLSSYRAQYALDAQYSAIVVPSIFFLAVLGLARVERRRWAATLPLAAALVTASLMMNWQYGWLGGKHFRGMPQSTERQRMIASMIDAIPPDASVSTLSDFVPHLSNRDQIYLYPTVEQADYILFDTALDATFYLVLGRDPRGTAIELLLPYVTSGEYGLAAGQDGVLLLQRGADTANNEEALRALGSVTYDAVNQFGSPTMLTVDDPAAASGAARLSPALADPLAEPVAVVSGPYATVIPGRYRVDFRLRLAEPPASEGLVSIIDVFSFAVGGQVVQHGISSEEFAARDATAGNASAPGGLSMAESGGPYHTFSLEFQTDRLLNDVEFRVLHTGLGALAVDKVTVERLGPPGQ